MNERMRCRQRGRGRPGLRAPPAWARRGLAACIAVAAYAAASPAMAHGCEPVDRYLIGHYHGECDRETELAQGQGEAKGADTYVGQFMKGKPGGKGVYTWESGARLEGVFKDGKAHGEGVYVTPRGVRYEGRFVDGKPDAMKVLDCPTTPGPLAC